MPETILLVSHHEMRIPASSDLHGSDRRNGQFLVLRRGLNDMHIQSTKYLFVLVLNSISPFFTSDSEERGERYVISLLNNSSFVTFQSLPTFLTNLPTSG